MAESWEISVTPVLFLSELRNNCTLPLPALVVASYLSPPIGLSIPVGVNRVTWIQMSSKGW